MKKNRKLRLLVFLAVVLLSRGLIVAQDTLDVAPFNDEGELNFIPTLWGDTSDTGERLNLDRVYRLQRGAVYIVDQTIDADYPIRLVADSNDDTKRPPMLVRGKYATGANIKTFFTFTGDNLSHSFKDIMFNGVDIDRAYFNQWNRGLKVAGDNISLELDGCIMNAWAGLFLEISGDNASLYITDSKYRNGVGGLSPPWGAQQNVIFSTRLKEVVFTNNTMFNTGGFWLFQEDGIADNVIVEHNTLFTGSIDLIRMRDLVNAKFRSNLFYGTHSYGQSESEREASWFDKDGEYLSMFSLDTSGVDLLANVGLVEADKNVLLTNNAYYSPQAMKDWWATIPGINTPVWMNSRTQGMFDNEVAYPLLHAADNIEMDPMFSDTDMESWVVGEVIKYHDAVRKGENPTARNYDTHSGVDDVLLVPWPLPESLEYTNATMLTGGHDGLPIGDLNWFPSKRAEYINPVGVEDVISNVNVSISPNPSSNRIYVECENNMHGLAIYNLSGSLVYNKVLNQRNTELDISKFDIGIYVLKITTEKGVISKKVIKQ